MRYQKEKRTFMVEKFFEFGHCSLVKRAWRKEFPGLKVPGDKTINNTVFRFKETGSIASLPPIQSKINEQREDAKNQLRTLISENPRLSVRKASRAVGMSYGSTRRFLLEDLHLKPFKDQEWHELKKPDYPKRVEFARWLTSLPEETFKFFICSDEAYFYLKEPINKQNNRSWLETRPTEWKEQPLHDEKVLVWCAMSAKRIYGPFFFESSVNQHNYLKMLKEFFWERHRKVPEYKKYYFQQDGATPHTSNLVQNWLKSKFSDFFLDKKKSPPRSPDLNPCDFYLWGHLKALVYTPLPKTLDDLKANIEREIKKINQEILESTFENFIKRCSLVIAAKGGHIESK